MTVGYGVRLASTPTSYIGTVRERDRSCQTAAMATVWFVPRPLASCERRAPGGLVGLLLAAQGGSEQLLPIPLANRQLSRSCSRPKRAACDTNHPPAGRLPRLGVWAGLKLKKRAVAERTPARLAEARIPLSINDHSMFHGTWSPRRLDSSVDGQEMEAGGNTVPQREREVVTRHSCG